MHTNTRPVHSSAHPWVRYVVLGGALAGFLVLSEPSRPGEQRKTTAASAPPVSVGLDDPGRDFLTSRPCPEAPPAPRLAVGKEITTAAGQRRRVLLDNGTVLFVNESSRVQYSGPDALTLFAGEIYVEVPHTTTPKDSFTINTPDRVIEGKPSPWAGGVRVEDKGTRVMLIRGRELAVQTGGKTVRLSGGTTLAPRSDT